MKKIPQEAYARQRMLAYSLKHGVTKASLRYQVSRKTVYKWLKRYDGTILSLRDRSHRPHGHPKQHSEEELCLIKRLVKRGGSDDVLMLYQKLVKKGYTRHYGSLKRVLKRLYAEKSEKRSPRKPKPYQRADYPGQKIQMDVKFVPKYCVADGKKYYQFTAKDECSRWTFREMYDEHSTYSAKDLLDLCQYSRHKNSNFYAVFIKASSSC